VGVFKDAAELYECIGGLFRRGAQDPEMGPKVRASKLIIKFNYTNPEAQLTIDAKNPPPEGMYFNVIEGENDLKADVTMSMEADVAHKFWFGKLNLVMALNRGMMRAKGPIAAILKLLPSIKPAYELYPQFLREIGKEDKIMG